MGPEDFKPGDRVRLQDHYKYKGVRYEDHEHPGIGDFGIISSQHHQDKRKNELAERICISWPQGLRWTDRECVQLIGRAGDYVSEDELKEAFESLGQTDNEPLIKLRDVITVLNAHEAELLDSGQVVDIMRATLGIQKQDDASVMLAKTIKLTTKGSIALQTMAKTAAFLQSDG